MSIEENITDIVNSIDNLAEQLNPANDFGQTMGDELANLGYQVSRVADALESILKHLQQK